jgi:hypothetical protein
MDNIRGETKNRKDIGVFGSIMNFTIILPWLK